MFVHLAIAIPTLLLFLVVGVLRIKRRSFVFLTEKEYVSFFLLLPMLSLSIITFLFTKQVETSNLAIALEREKRELGLRQFTQEVKFKLSLIKNVTDYDLDIWYEKTAETITPKSIKLLIIPLLCDSKRVPKVYVDIEELKRYDLTIELSQDKVVFQNNRCRISNVFMIIQNRSNIKNYMEAKKLECDGIGIDVFYNEVPGLLKPLKQFVLKYISEAKK